MEHRIGASESKILLGISAQCLSLRDFVGCRNYAIQARNADPKLSDVDEILAIADTLIASERRVGKNQHDWYSILQLRRPISGNLQLEPSYYVKLLNLVKASENKFAFAGDAKELILKAWMVLSDPKKKNQYDDEMSNEEEIPKWGEELAEPSCNYPKDKGSEGNTKTFWTVCPYCYCLFQYEKLYEDCCLRCQNCDRAFHGVAINAPTPEVLLVPGKEQYYFCYGVLPMRYESSEKRNMNVNENGNKGEVGRSGYGSGSNHAYIEISDDEEEDDCLDELNYYAGNGQQGNNGDSSVKAEKCNEEEMVKMGEGIQRNLKEYNTEITELMNDGRRGKKKIETRAKRIMNVKSNVESGEESEEIENPISNECHDPEVLFHEGDDDIYISLMDI